MTAQSTTAGPRRLRSPLASLAAFVTLTSGVPVQEPTSGLDVMQRYDAEQRTADSEVTVDLTLFNARGDARERRLVLRTKTRPDGRRLLLIQFLAPGDVEGTGFLQIENHDRADDLWLYLPALRRVRRIAGSSRTDRFVGTHFTFEDLDPEDLAAHDYTLAGVDTLDGRSAWVVEAVGANGAEESAYSRRRLWIDQERSVLLRADLYAREGGLTKRLRAEEVRQVAESGPWRAHRVEMEDLIDGSRTVLKMNTYTLDQGLPDDLFTERTLRRGR